VWTMTHRPIVSLPAFAVVLVLVLVAGAPASAADIPRLRIVDRHVRALLHEGLARSPSLRALVERLARGDVVVYLRCEPLPPNLEGRLTFVSAVGGFRYVLVHLAPDRPHLRRIGALGHELQHAVEIAERPDIVDQASLGRAYAGFGFERRAAFYGVTAFDTVAAVDAGDQIRREITRSAAGDE